MHSMPDFSSLMKDKFYAEKLLLLKLCSFYISREARSNIENLVASVKDWQMLSRMAKTNGIAALVYKNSNALNMHTFDKSCKEALLLEAHNITFRNTLKILAMKELFAVFEKENIDFILLKGYQFIRKYYQDLDLRDIGDLDVLIVPESFEKAVQFMEKYPYRLVNRPYEHHKMYISKTYNVQVELHKDVISPPSCFHYTLNEFFQNTVIFRDNEISAKVLNDRYELYLQLMNALYSHAFYPFKARTIVDIQAVLLSLGDAADWRKIIAHAQSMGAFNYLLISARTCNDFFNWPMPAIFHQHVYRKSFEKKYQHFLSFLFHYMEYIQDLKHRKNPALLQILIADTFMNSVRLFYHYLFLPEKYLRYSRKDLNIPVFLFYLIRLFLLPFRFAYKTIYSYLRSRK